MNKKTLFTIMAGIISFATGAQTTADAQPVTQTPHGFSIGLNTGTVWNTTAIRQYSAGKVGATMGIGLYYRFNKHWEAGITTDFKYFNDNRKDPENYYYTPASPATARYYPQLSTQIFVNYHFLTGKLDAYTGLSSGATTMIYNDYNNAGSAGIWQNSESGIVHGMHIGINYPLNRHWSLNMQANAELLTIGTRNTRTAMFIPSATIGIRFHF